MLPKRRSEDGEPVGELREGVAVVVDELAQVLVERHRRPHLGVPGGAETCLDDRECVVAVAGGETFQAHALRVPRRDRAVLGVDHDEVDAAPVRVTPG